MKWILGILVLLLVGFFYGFVPWFLTGIATTSRFHFRDPNDGKTPKEFGMDYHSVEFRSRDGIALKGWYIPGGAAGGEQPRGTIVYCHGHNRTRVEMLPEAQYGHKLGYNALVFDLRHQGQSGGRMTSVGYWERLDAEAAVQYALNDERAQQPVILWGVSMGAAAALLAAAESPNVAAVISDSVFPNFKELIAHHYYLFRTFARRRWWWFPSLPGFPLLDEVTYWIAWRAHFKPSDFDLEKSVNRINPRPILFVAVAGDPRMPPSYAQELYSEATSPEKQIVVLPGRRHGEGFNDANKPYEEAVSRFLDRVNSARGAAGTVGRSGQRQDSVPSGYRTP
jgi:fermentation-respiration switch protein FrsA (DUF1100 family)